MQVYTDSSVFSPFLNTSTDCSVAGGIRVSIISMRPITGVTINPLDTFIQLMDGVGIP